MLLKRPIYLGSSLHLKFRYFLMAPVTCIFDSFFAGILSNISFIHAHCFNNEKNISCVLQLLEKVSFQGAAIPLALALSCQLRRVYSDIPSSLEILLLDRIILLN